MYARPVFQAIISTKVAASQQHAKKKNQISLKDKSSAAIDA
jgi:hypothetical protein